MTAVAVFSHEESEEQLSELRSFYMEHGINIDKQGPTDLFENLKELLNTGKSMLTSLSSEKDLELILNSMFSLFITFKDKQLVELVHLLCELITDKNICGQGWNSNAGVGLRLLSNLFNFHMDISDISPALQIYELENLLLMAGRSRLTQFLTIGVPQIDKYARKWKLDIEKKRELYRKLHATLCEDEHHDQAAEVMVTLLKTYTEKDATTARDDARECVRTAVVNPKSFTFDHLLHLDAVKSLEKTDPLMFKVLNIFVHDSLPAYRQFTAKNTNFVQEQLKVKPELLERKIKMLTLISLAEHKQVIPLVELSKHLEISDEQELEEFIIDAIRNEAINGKIDEMNSQLIITFYQQRVFGQVQWLQLQKRLATLVGNLQEFHTALYEVVVGDKAGVENITE